MPIMRCSAASSMASSWLGLGLGLGLGLRVRVSLTITLTLTLTLALTLALAPALLLQVEDDGLEVVGGREPVQRREAAPYAPDERLGQTQHAQVLRGRRVLVGHPEQRLRAQALGLGPGVGLGLGSGVGLGLGLTCGWRRTNSARRARPT